MKGKILIIDDEATILEAVKMILEDFEFSVTTCGDAIEGERLAVENDFDLILLDIRMPEKNGAEVTKAVLTKRPDAKIFVITGFPGDQLTQRALECGARGVLKKPFEIAKILDFFNSKDRVKEGENR